MKIYHTETQADYDALMVELEERGLKWASGRKPTESKDWVDHEEKTGVVIEKRITRACIGVLKLDYPNIPITKYKAKADEKMRFTKENVYKLFIQYRKVGNYTFNDLQDEILNLDDTPEKVVVPKFVADFYEECENAALEFLITQLEATHSRSELGEWYRSCSGRHRNGNANAQEVIAKMKLYGYEVEREPLYCVKINGQYLVKMIPERNVHKFVEEEKLCIWDTQAYQLTEVEIKKIDERYIPFMVPVDGANKD